MTVRISTSLDGISASDLDGGFWEGWPTHPGPERHLELLRQSMAAAIALDGDDNVVGFATIAPCYMIDVACDDDVVPFYERLGFRRTNAMIRRDYAAQAGT